MNKMHKHFSFLQRYLYTQNIYKLRKEISTILIDSLNHIITIPNIMQKIIAYLNNSFKLKHSVEGKG